MVGILRLCTIYIIARHEKYSNFDKVVCGDGVCNGTETTTSCALDCCAVHDNECAVTSGVSCPPIRCGYPGCLEPSPNYATNPFDKPFHTPSALCPKVQLTGTGSKLEFLTFVLQDQSTWSHHTRGCTHLGHNFPCPVYLSVLRRPHPSLGLLHISLWKDTINANEGQWVMTWSVPGRPVDQRNLEQPM